MRLDSARALKRELLGESRPRLQALDLGVPATRPGALGPERADVALGIAPPAGTDPDGYRLAVRVQDRGVLGTPVLAELERASHGELDVRYIGRVLRRRRVRPLAIGASIGHHAITAGTLGAFVVPAGGGAPLVLSNNHVLADENRARAGDEILQPGPFDGGRRGADRIGALERFVALRTDGANRVDGALARLDDAIAIDPLHPATRVPIGGPLPPPEARAVLKIGRTTGLTRGEVTAIEVDGVVVDFSAGALRFDDQIEVGSTSAAPFSQGGDSGSLIVDADSTAAVALLFAGSDQGGAHGAGVTFGNPIGAVLEELALAGFVAA